jgi:hypothetical protein
VQLSIKKIIYTDTLTFVLILFPIVLFILAVDAGYIGVLAFLLGKGAINPEGTRALDETFMKMTTDGCFTLFPLAILRIYLMHQWLTHSDTVPGFITFIPAISDRGTFKYEYSYNGQDYKSFNCVQRTKDSFDIFPGQTLELTVYKRNPKKAFIKKLYFVYS